MMTYCICVHVHYVHTNVCINKNFQLTKCFGSWCLKAFSNVVLIKIILLSQVVAKYGVLTCIQKPNYGLCIIFLLQHSHWLKEDNVASGKKIIISFPVTLGYRFGILHKLFLKDLTIKFERLFTGNIFRRASLWILSFV